MTMDANAPYLPTADAKDNPPAKRNARKTILLWLLLILMFVSIYQLLVGPTHRHGPTPMTTTTPCSSTGEIVFWPTMVSLGVIAMVLFAFMRQFRGGARLNAKLEPGLIALADGDLGHAAQVFTTVAHEYRKQALYSAVAKLSLATTLMRQGELAKATEIAMAVERAPGLMFGSEARLMAAIDLAMIYALRGQTDVARRWCEDGRKRLARGQNRTVTAALLRLCEILVLAREGKRDVGAKAVDRDWRRLEEALTAASMKKAWLLRAFVAANDGTRANIGPWTAVVRRGELSWMAVDWPELQAFLVAHELA